MATLYNHASAAETANGSSGTFLHQPAGRSRQRQVEGLEFSTLAALPVVVQGNLSAQAGTNPTLQLVYETSWDGEVTWQQVWISAVLSTIAPIAAVVIGAGDRLLGPKGRLRWLIGGTAGPSVTFTASVNTVN